jgi:hypothetical protein
MRKPPYLSKEIYVLTSCKYPVRAFTVVLGLVAPLSILAPAHAQVSLQPVNPSTGGKAPVISAPSSNSGTTGSIAPAAGGGSTKPGAGGPNGVGGGAGSSGSASDVISQFAAGKQKVRAQDAVSNLEKAANEQK